MNLKNTPVEELAMGAAKELLNDAFAKTIKNIQDPNTKASQMRKITLTLKLVPQDNRESCSNEIACDTKLAPNRGVAGHVYVGMQNGDPVAYESNPDQRSFDWDVNVPDRGEVEKS